MLIESSTPKRRFLSVHIILKTLCIKKETEALKEIRTSGWQQQTTIKSHILNHELNKGKYNMINDVYQNGVQR